MSQSGRVSVILPVYNREGFVDRALRSALDQTYPDIEVLVINDGSTDGTADKLREFGDRIRVLRQPNRGPYAARNMGLRHATGEYIAFLDSDDAWLPHRLALQVNLMRANPAAGLVYGNGTVVSPARQSSRTFFGYNPPARGRVFRRLLDANFVPQSSVLVRASCFRELGPFAEAPLAADYHKWLQMALQYDFDYVDDIVFTYTLHKEGISWNRVRRYQVLVELFKDIESHVTDEGDLRALRRRRLELELKLSILYLIEGSVRLSSSLVGSGTHSTARERFSALIRLLGAETRAALRRRAWQSRPPIR